MPSPISYDAVRDVVARAHAAPFELRPAGPEDKAAVLALMDEAVAWMTSRGNTEQWGTEPFSASPRRVAQADGWFGAGGAVLAMRDGKAAGALVVGEAPAYVAEPTEPEVYVVLLVASRDPRARGIGRVLLECAEDIGHELGVPALRVDCYAGGDQALVRFYESAGFTRTEAFEVKGWPGQVLERRLG